MFLLDYPHFRFYFHFVQIRFNFSACKTIVPENHYGLTYCFKSTRAYMLLFITGFILTPTPSPWVDLGLHEIYSVFLFNYFSRSHFLLFQYAVEESDMGICLRRLKHDRGAWVCWNIQFRKLVVLFNIHYLCQRQFEVTLKLLKYAI